MKLSKLILSICNFGCYIIADPSDNSVTLSRQLFRRMCIAGKDEAKVFVFKIPYTGEYGFTINPTIEQPSQLSDIQYNSKHRCIGFEALCPTVNRIYYDYGIPPYIRTKLSVTAHKRKGLMYYIINKPYHYGKSYR